MTAMKQSKPTKILSDLFAIFLFAFTYVYGPFCIFWFTLYILFYTKYWLFWLIYLLWIFYDSDSDCGERRSDLFALKWYKHFQYYFPITFQIASNFQLDPKRNYLFCAVPHGFMSTGFSYSLNTKDGFDDYFPYHNPHAVTLKQGFYVPFYRELLIAAGCISASADRITRLLLKSEGGEVVGLVTGGAEEAKYCKPGKYKIVLSARKGFVRIALKCGAPLVPCISFGEVDILDQFEHPVLRRLQNIVKKVIGFYPVLPKGIVPFVPRRRRIDVVGKFPILIKLLLRVRWVRLMANS